jgi:hypothetical protein
MTELPDEYKTATTANSFMNIHKKYLQLDKAFTLYEPYEINETRSELILQLLDLGVFTFSIQQCAKGAIKWDGETVQEFWQKPFVSFVVTKEPMELLETLKDRLGDAAYVYGILLRPYTILSNPGKLAVTRARSAHFKTDLENVTWNVDTVIHAIDPSDENLFSLDFFRNNKAWIIDLAVTEWGVDMNLLEFLKSVIAKIHNTRNLFTMLPSEIFSMITKYLSLASVKSLRQCSLKCLDQTEYAFKQYFIVDTTLHDAQKFKKSLQGRAPAYPKALIIRARYFKWPEWPNKSKDIYDEVMKSILEALQETGQEIKVTFRGLNGYYFITRHFLTVFARYQWPITLENTGVKHFTFPHFWFPSAVLAVELLVSKNSEERPGEIGPLQWAGPVLRRWVLYPGRIISLVYEEKDQLSDQEEQMVKDLGKVAEIKKTKVDMKLGTLKYFKRSNKISIAEYLLRNNVEYEGI